MCRTYGNMIRQHYGTWINEDGPDVVGMLQLALNVRRSQFYTERSNA